MPPRPARPFFRDREDAGEALAIALSRYGGRRDVIVLGLPRGGVPVAARVAARLHVPLDVWLVRKLGLPGNEELAIGAIASGGILEWNLDVLRQAPVLEAELRDLVRRETAELERRERAYRGDRRPVELGGRIVIVVDDGLATGSTMRAAVRALQRGSPSRIVAAAPVGAAATCDALAAVADECVCVHTPDPFFAVGRWYEDFIPTTDAEVVACLAGAASTATADGAPADGS